MNFKEVKAMDEPDPINPVHPHKVSNPQQILMLIRAIDAALKGGALNEEEATALKSLLEKGYVSPTLINDYVSNYKHNGKTIEQFVTDKLARA